MAHKLDTKALLQLSMFEKITKAKVKDCFEDSFKQLVFCVQSGQLHQAIGKAGVKVKKIEQLLKRKIRVIEFNPTLSLFVEGLCYPHKGTVEDESRLLWDSKKEIVVITPIDHETRGYLIGKGASNLRNMEDITRRYFTVDEIRVT